LNDALLRNPGIRLCTVALARLRRSERGWDATLSSAGHPLPLLKRRDGEPVSAGRPGTLLGAVRNPTFDETTVTLEPGDVLVFFTDGVPEGRRNGDEFYDEERLREVVAQTPPDAAALADRVLADVLAFQNGVPRDDIALVILRVPE
jgi:sigma-B regulation protein RsbU (phosphoserine phosphatase)